jgi:hypothetical protein
MLEPFETVIVDLLSIKAPPPLYKEACSFPPQQYGRGRGVNLLFREERTPHLSLFRWSSRRDGQRRS